MPETKEKLKRDFARRLVEATEYRGLRKHGRNAYILRELENRGDQVTATSVSRWFRPEFENNMPSQHRIKLLSEILNVRYEWLISGHGPMVTTEAVDEYGETVEIVINQVPVVDRDSLVMWLSGDLEPAEKVVVSGSVGPDAFAYQVPDSALVPRVAKRSVVVVDPSHKRESGKLGMVSRNGAVLLGEVIFTEDSVMLEPCNPSYPTVNLPADSFVGHITHIAQQPL